VRLDPAAAAYCRRIIELPDMVTWREAALREPDEVEELEVEF
jgi:glutathione S-transferase